MKLAWAIRAAQHDAQAMIRYLRRHADVLGINPLAIGIMGYSAGAVTSMNVAYRSFDPGGEEYLGDTGNLGYASDVSAAVSLAGAANNVTPNAPPVQMHHGVKDTTVPYAAGVNTCTTAVSMGDECTLYSYDTTHLLSPFYPTEIRPKVYEFFAEELAGMVVPPRAREGYHALTPSRVLDTRSGLGAPQARLGPGGTVDLTVTGVGGVPASGVASVVLNVTAANPSAYSHVVVWPGGEAMPDTSSLNLRPGENVANLVQVDVGGGGDVRFTNHAGEVDLVADVVGWYDEGTGGGDRMVAVVPARVFDSRAGTGPLVGTTTVPVAGVGGVPSDASAVVVNLTAVLGTAASHLTAWPTGATMPGTSNVNFDAGTVVPNLAVVKVGAGGTIQVHNNAGAAHVLVDVYGYYRPGEGLGAMHVAEARILDTRSGVGGRATPVGAGQTVNLRVRGAGSLPRTGITAVALNVTAVNPSATSHITVWPHGAAQPTTSNLNLSPGRTVPNLVIVLVGPDGTIDLANNSGDVDLLADVVGFFA